MLLHCVKVSQNDWGRMESYPFFLVFHQDFLQSHFLASLSVLCFEHLPVVGGGTTENFIIHL